MVAVMILRLSRMIASTLTMRLQVQNSTQGGGLSRGEFPGQQGCCKVLFPHPPKKRNKVGTPHAPAKGCALLLLTENLSAGSTGWKPAKGCALCTPAFGSILHQPCPGSSSFRVQKYVHHPGVMVSAKEWVSHFQYRYHYSSRSLLECHY